MVNKQLLILVLVLGGLALVGGVVMLGKRQKGGEEATTPGEEETTPGATAEECAVGGYWRVGGVEYRITGVETQSLGGKSTKLCCAKWEDTASGQKMKYCYDPSASEDYIIWSARGETGGEYVKTMESYRQNDQTCTKTYDLKGNVAAEACQ